MVFIATDCPTDSIVIQNPVRTTGRGFLMRETGDANSPVFAWDSEDGRVIIVGADKYGS